MKCSSSHCRVPKVGDKEIDLHVFYREVTARGGLEQVTFVFKKV